MSPIGFSDEELDSLSALAAILPPSDRSLNPADLRNAGDLPHPRASPRRVRGRDRGKPTGRLMIRSRTRVVQRNPKGDW